MNTWQRKISSILVVATTNHHRVPIRERWSRPIPLDSRRDLHHFLQEGQYEPDSYVLRASTRHSPYVKPDPVVCYQDEPLRIVAYRMAETNLTRFPVVERDNPHKLVGMVSLTDLLKARVRNLHEERHRERVLRLRTLLPRGQGSQRVT